MFDIGWSELVVIAVVALIAIGPKELPGVLRMENSAYARQFKRLSALPAPGRCRHRTVTSLPQVFRIPAERKTTG